jgi:signal recognition particle subunit SRP54
MLETLSKGFRTVKHRLQGKRELTAENINDALRDIRISLLEADVDFKVVRGFIGGGQGEGRSARWCRSSRASGDRRQEGRPGDHFIKICQDELEALMGPVDTSLDFAAGITKIMMIGLQGSGKTTTTGKLAKYLIEKGRKPLLVAADIYRPAAIDQLRCSASARGAGLARGRARHRRSSARGRSTRPQSAGATSSSSTPPAAWPSTRP